MEINDTDIHIIICAAGSGSRFGADIPKQYCALEGRPVLMHTIDAMRRACPGATLTLVISEAMEPLWREQCETHRYTSPDIVYGGDTRWHSVSNALRADRRRSRYVLVHDGARPLVSDAVVQGVIEALRRGHTGAVPAVAVTDTLVISDDGTTFEATDRGRYRAVQTPQGFCGDALRDAYGTLGYRATFTDDASVLRAAGVSDIVLTAGATDNIKITNPDDLRIATVLAGR